MNLSLELVIIPVADVDRAKEFYVDKMGFNLDVDHQPNESFRVVQMTPPGSACSITVGVGVSDAEPGSVRGTHLCVGDIEETRAELVARGVDISEPFHFGEAGQTPGVHPERADYGTFASFSDPDGNTWLLQEVSRVSKEEGTS